MGKMVGVKKIVSMHDINRVFVDLPCVDYITVDSVTDSTVSLVIHLNSSKRPGENTKELMDFNDRCVVLSRILDRNVHFVFECRKWSDSFLLFFTKPLNKKLKNPVKNG